MLRDLSSDFPICKTINYLNAASIGPVPKPIVDEYTASILESVTRNSFLELIPKDLDISPLRSWILPASSFTLQMRFFHDPGGEVTPITSVDDIKIRGDYRVP
jgi:hypothetical protein